MDQSLNSRKDALLASDQSLRLGNGAGWPDHRLLKSQHPLIDTENRVQGTSNGLQRLGDAWQTRCDDPPAGAESLPPPLPWGSHAQNPREEDDTEASAAHPTLSPA